VGGSQVVSHCPRGIHLHSRARCPVGGRTAGCGSGVDCRLKFGSTASVHGIPLERLPCSDTGTQLFSWFLYMKRYVTGDYPTRYKLRIAWEGELPGW